MNFGHLEYFAFFILIPILIVFYLFAYRRKRKLLEKFGNIEIIAKMTKSSSKQRQVIKTILIILAISFLIFSITMPQYGRKEQPLTRTGIDVYIALDTSRSMLAEDIKPNRLENAKLELKTLIRRLQGDRIGLITFAGTAFIQCPLTLDYGMVEDVLDSVDYRSVLVQGTSIGDAIRKAIASFKEVPKGNKMIILLTDGEDQDTEPLVAAEEAAAEGIYIYCIGIGSDKGELIPEVDEAGNKTGSFKEDDKGEKVLTKLDSNTLREIAAKTNGKAYIATKGLLEVDRIIQDTDEMQKRIISSKVYNIYEDRFQYFLFPAILLLIIEILLPERSKKKEEWGGRFE